MRGRPSVGSTPVLGAVAFQRVAEVLGRRGAVAAGLAVVPD